MGSEMCIRDSYSNGKNETNPFQFVTSFSQGFDEFMSTINLDNILNSVSTAIAWLDSIVQSMKG